MIMGAMLDGDTGLEVGVLPFSLKDDHPIVDCWICDHGEETIDAARWPTPAIDWDLDNE